ncbi:MAG TPA: hypothetical protein VFU02_00975 [Polyangiaceae bacterium]|nr:hypothetical protein [Polyangiaceae bacterium]
MVACGSDDDSAASTNGGGGDQGSGGSAGGSGGAPTDGGGGDTSTGGGGDTSTDGGGSPGDFSSVWQAESVELMLFDAANPSNFESHTLEMPAKVEAPGDSREVELYLQFEGEYRITYAYTEGDSAYYRVSEPALSADDFYSVQSADGLHSYSIEDGKLTDTAQQSFGTAWSAITTTTYKKVDDFPPGDWPSKVVSYESGGAQ